MLFDNWNREPGVGKTAIAEGLAQRYDFSPLWTVPIFVANESQIHTYIQLISIVELSAATYPNP